MVEHDDDLPVFRLSGELDAAAVFGLQDAVESSLTFGERHLRFDLSDLELIDSGGFAMLIGVHKQVRDAGGHLEVTGASETIRRAFQMAGLAWLLTSQQSEPDDADLHIEAPSGADYVSTACTVGEHEECQRRPIVRCACQCHRTEAD